MMIMNAALKGAGVQLNRQQYAGGRRAAFTNKFYNKH
jgi:hypothetical protein